MKRWGFFFALAFSACEGGQTDGSHVIEEGDPDLPDGGFGIGPIVDETASPDMGMMAGVQPGSTARVVASSLNLRTAPGTSAAILVAMPCGASVQVLDGPSTTPVAGWWNVQYETQTGWASGKYLVPESSFTPGLCDPQPAPSPSPSLPPTVAAIFERAQSGVGFSYFWGHGSWSTDRSQLGTCTGSCPDCTHTSQFGADCSGFVSKVWQVPAATPIEYDTHPYSTYNFYYEETHWKKVPRSTLKPADSLVRRQNGAGHMALVESASDPFGAIWVYESHACATGITRNLRTFDSSFIAIRRDGL